MNNRRYLCLFLLAFLVILSTVDGAELGSLVSKKKDTDSVEHTKSTEYSRENMSVKDVDDPVLNWGKKVGQEMLEDMQNADPPDGTTEPIGDGSCQQHLNVSVFLGGDWSGTDLTVQASSMPNRVSDYSTENDTNSGRIGYQSHGDYCVAGRYQIGVGARPSVNASSKNYFSVGFNVPMGARYCTVTVMASSRSILHTQCRE